MEDKTRRIKLHYDPITNIISVQEKTRPKRNILSVVSITVACVSMLLSILTLVIDNKSIEISGAQYKIDEAAYEHSISPVFTITRDFTDGNINEYRIVNSGAPIKDATLNVESFIETQIGKNEEDMFFHGTKILMSASENQKYDYDAHTNSFSGVRIDYKFGEKVIKDMKEQLVSIYDYVNIGLQNFLSISYSDMEGNKYIEYYRVTYGFFRYIETEEMGWLEFKQMDSYEELGYTGTNKTVDKWKMYVAYILGYKHFDFLDGYPEYYEKITVTYIADIVNGIISSYNQWYDGR